MQTPSDIEWILLLSRDNFYKETLQRNNVPNTGDNANMWVDDMTANT